MIQWKIFLEVKIKKFQNTGNAASFHKKIVKKQKTCYKHNKIKYHIKKINMTQQLLINMVTLLL